MANAPRSRQRGPTLTAAEIEQIGTLAAEGLPAITIAERMGRGENTIRLACLNHHFDLAPKERKAPAPIPSDTWPDNVVERLTALYAEGLSYVGISRELGLNPNQVRGKIVRLGIQRPSLGRVPTAPKSVFRPRPEPKTAAPAKPTTEKLREECWKPNELSRPWEERASKQCQWPVDAPQGQAGYWSCCQKAHRNGYCADHYRVSLPVSATAQPEPGRRAA